MDFSLQTTGMRLCFLTGGGTPLPVPWKHPKGSDGKWEGLGSTAEK